jgi:hypothetical protein
MKSQFFSQHSNEGVGWSYRQRCNNQDFDVGECAQEYTKK